ncbi:P-loop containing nucleoside triphosphate hydrolase protein, partial [Blastocladiella britannica]
MGSRGATANLSTVVSAPTPQLTPRVVATQLTDHAGNSRATDLFLGPQIALLAAEPPALAERLASGTVTDPIEIMDAAGPLAESDPEASVPPVVATGAHATVTIAAKAWMTMVREGKDQLVSVHSTANSAQNQVQHAVIEQLLRCSAATTKPGSGDPPGVSTAAYKPGSSRLHTDVIKAHLLMEALLTASTATGTPVLRAGLVTEMQFDARGALVGAKLCEYHLETMRAGSPPGSESNFHALYGLVLAAATIPDVKAAYSLNGDVTKYNLLVKGYRACAKNVSAGTYLVMTKCMKALGLKKRFQSSFFGVLAALVHLGNLEFETDARSKSAAACVRNVDVLDTAANLIGIKSDTLQGLFTTKTVVVGDSAYTDFLSPVEARETLERFVSTVYSTLVVYILDLANRKLSNEQALVSSVTVAAMGGVESTHANAAHQLCRNYATERMNQFVLQRLADSAREMGVAADLTNGLATAVGSAGAVSLLDELFDTLERETARAASATEAKRAAAVTAAGLAVPTSPTSVSSVNVLDTLNAKYSGHTAYARAPGDVASGFCVRHSTGSVTYSITATLQNLSSGMLPAQWITACRSDATSNAVLRQAFSEQRIVTITSVKRAKTIVAGRAANLRRTLTTKNKTQGLRERKATLLSKTQRPGLLQPGSPIKGPDSPGNTAMSAEDDESDVPLSRLSSTIVGQSRAMVDRMFSTLGSCRAWQVTVAPTSAITEDVARGLALAPLIAVVRAANGAFAAWPTADLAELFPGLCATAGGTEPNTIIESLKQICPHLYPIVDPNDQEGATYKSVLAREHEWLALEAAEYKIRGATDGPFRVEVNPLMFAKVQDRAQREKSRSGADSGGETDDDAVSTTGTAITMDDLELGALDPVEADAREAAARAVANGEKPVDPKKVEARKAKEAAKAARKKLTPIRRRWMCATTCMTWWIPDMFLNWDAIKKTTPKQAAEIRQSWREKVALCIIIAFLSALMIFFITGFSALMCPNFNMLTLDELYKGQRLPTTTSKLYAMHGNVYDLTAYPHPGGSGFAPQEYSNMRGTDVSGYFPRWNPTTGDVPTVCKATSVKRRRDLSSQDSVDTPVVVAAEATSGTSHSLERRANVAGMNPTKCIASSASVNATGYCHSYSAFAFKVSIKDPALNVAVSVKVAWAMTDVGLRNTDASRFIVVSGKVYDVTLLLGTTSPFTTAEKQLFAANGGRDITSFAANYINIPCLDAIAYVGVVDNRDYLVCNISSYILKAVTYIMVAVMVIKFLSALQLGKKRTPEDINKYVIMQVPCYSESVDSLKKTIDSLAVTTYDDTRKLLFIVADGMIKGSGNEKPTPDLVLDILGVPDSHRDVASFSYHSIGDGSKAHNKVRIYSGLYHIHGRAIPYLVVIKCGTETETAKAGNRGKRDS